MKRLATFAVIPLFAGFIFAQTQTRTETTTTTTNNYSGTLVDAGCYTQHTHEKQTNSDNNSTTTTETNRDASTCPVTETTTTFGLLTPEGRYVAFDQGGNSHTVEIVKNNKAWRNYISGKKPVKVRVVGTANGDTIIVKEIR